MHDGAERRRPPVTLGALYQRYESEFVSSLVAAACLGVSSSNLIVQACISSGIWFCGAYALPAERFTLPKLRRAVLGVTKMKRLQYTVIIVF